MYINTYNEVNIGYIMTEESRVPETNSTPKPLSALLSQLHQYLTIRSLDPKTIQDHLRRITNLSKSLKTTNYRVIFDIMKVGEVISSLRKPNTNKIISHQTQRKYYSSLEQIVCS